MCVRTNSKSREHNLGGHYCYVIIASIKCINPFIWSCVDCWQRLNSVTDKIYYGAIWSGIVICAVGMNVGTFVEQLLTHSKCVTSHTSPGPHHRPGTPILLLPGLSLSNNMGFTRYISEDISCEIYIFSF